jgi:hypothetical protein
MISHSNFLLDVTNAMHHVVLAELPSSPLSLAVHQRQAGKRDKPITVHM